MKDNNQTCLAIWLIWAFISFYSRAQVCVWEREREREWDLGESVGVWAWVSEGIWWVHVFPLFLCFVVLTYLHTYLLSKSVEATRERSVEDVTPEADATRRSNSRRRPKNQLTGFTTQQSKLEYLDRMLLLVGSKWCTFGTAQSSSSMIYRRSRIGRLE